MCGNVGIRIVILSQGFALVQDIVGAPPIPEMMVETSWHLPSPCALLVVEVEMMRVFITSSTFVASPCWMRRFLSRISCVRPGCSRSWAVSFEGVRAIAIALWPLRKVRARQAFAQPPVAPKNAIVDWDMMRWWLWW